MKFLKMQQRFALLVSMVLVSFFITHQEKIHAQSPPANFQDQVYSTGWSEVEGFVYDANGRQYVWEKAGKVWIVDTNGVKLTNALLDISDEVGGWRDHGLNGFALDPNFLSNGYFYIMYTVDRYYLLHSTDLNYNAATNEYYNATIVRVTRYTANSATNFNSVVSGSRLVLIGEDKKTGIPLLHESHSGGSLVFGRDGSLLISTGDGASYNFTDNGGGATYWNQGLTDTIIRPKENIGAFRSQLVDCMAGKILRIDPATGNGLASNPFYDASNPRAPKSRVWALGLRNPFRMTIRPGTGSTDITAGDPGVLYVGDVGWGTWEDLQVIKGPGKNCGWPIYEGLTLHTGYNSLATQNLDAPNPLFGIGGCTQQYFTFQNLLKQAVLNQAGIQFTNPCNAGVLIPSTIPVFFHDRPAIDWKHGNESRTGIWIGNNASEINLDTSISPVKGPRFGGNASVGGVWYTGTKYPLKYQNTYFHMDFGGQWIRNFMFSNTNNPDSVRNFETGSGACVFINQNPKDGLLYYVVFPNQIRKISYLLTVNNPPVAHASSDLKYGASPLMIHFTGSLSTDPENQPLSYLWKFGNGDSSIAADPIYTYTVGSGMPTSYYAKLKVTDNVGQVSYDSVLISVNNTPPMVQITSFNDGDLYTTAGNTILPLQALVSDLEHTSNQLFYRWQTRLIHNNHEHPEAPDTNKITSTTISPVGCNGESFYFSISLTVTDAAGLSTTVISNIYPACNPPDAQFMADDTVICRSDYVQFTDLSTNLPTTYSWSFPGGIPSTSTLKNPLVHYTTGGFKSVTLIVISPMGTDTLTKTDYINVKRPTTSTISPLGPTTFCNGGSVMLQGKTGGSFTYEWKRNGNLISGATSSTYLASKTGNYKVSLTNAAGCKNTSAPVSVFADPDAVITPGGSTTFCLGDSVLLTANTGAGYLYQWKLNNVNIPGVTGQQYYAKNGGKYTVKVTTPTLCTRVSYSVQVTVPCKLSGTSNASQLFLNPNPASQYCHLSMSLPDEQVVSVTLFDAIGRQVLSFPNKLYYAGYQEIELPVENLQAGIYICKIQIGNTNQTLKLVIDN